MTPLYFLHLLILVGLICIPILPLSVLKYAIYLPLIISMSWVIFDGCIISLAQDELENKQEFTYDVARRFLPTVTPSQVNNFLTTYFVFSTLVGSWRLGC